MTRAHRELCQDNDLLRETLRSQGLPLEDLGLAAREAELTSFDAALENNKVLAGCAAHWPGYVARRNANSNPSMNTSSADRLTLREDLHQQAAQMHAKLAATIGCPKPVPVLGQDVEGDIHRLTAYIEERRGDMGYSAFAAASALVGRVPTGADAAAGKPGGPAGVAREALTALASLTPAQAQLYSQWQAVEHGDPRARSEFIRSHESELLSLAAAIAQAEGSTTRAQEPPAQASPAQAGASADEQLLAQYQAVAADPVARNKFIRAHDADIRALLLRANHSNK